jgi:uncharacterized membrane protein
MAKEPLSFGDRLADAVCAWVGSWAFIIFQGVMIVGWITGSVLHWFNFDPPPFIALNLVISVLTAYAAPFILLSQQRQSMHDRVTLEADLEANVQELAKLDAIEIRLSEHIEAQMQEVARELREVIATMSAVKDQQITSPQPGYSREGEKLCVCGKRGDTVCG